MGVSTQEFRNWWQRHSEKDDKRLLMVARSKLSRLELEALTKYIKNK